MKGKITDIKHEKKVKIGDNYFGDRYSISVENSKYQKNIPFFSNEDVTHMIGKSIFFEKRDKLNTLVSRLQKIGINIELSINYPWVYITKVNSIRVKEKFKSNYAFTAFFANNNANKITEEINPSYLFSNRKKVFDLIRKYIS